MRCHRHCRCCDSFEDTGQRWTWGQRARHVGQPQSAAGPGGALRHRARHSGRDPSRACCLAIAKGNASWGCCRALLTPLALGRPCLTVCVTSWIRTATGCTRLSTSNHRPHLSMTPCLRLFVHDHTSDPVRSARIRIHVKKRFRVTGWPPGNCKQQLGAMITRPAPATAHGQRFESEEELEI